ncbi:related to replication factor C protein [Ustilago sp. UG-2017b]|nr:related to replication factor C protein [Ustilago sp. UG-2017b]
MPPKKPSTPLPKGQASLSTFFGGGGGAKSAGPASSPASSQEARSTTRTSPATKKAEPTSKYLADKTRSSTNRRSTTATKADPMVIDDSDNNNNDDDDDRPAPKAKAKPASAKNSPRKSTTIKRKAKDDSSDDNQDDDYNDEEDEEEEFKPAPKRPATTASKAKAATSTTTQPTRRAAANAKAIKIDDSDDEEDSEFEAAPPAKRITSENKGAAPAKAWPAKKPAPAPAPAAATKAYPQPPTAAPAAKPNWREMQARRAAGPSAPGSKEIPQGAPNCLAGLTLVFTGELCSLSREEAVELAKRYGARITGSPSSKTSYVVLGEGAGPKKMDSIHKNKIPTLDEDEFLNLIRTRAAGQLDEKTKAKMKAEENKIEQVAKALGPPCKGAGADVDAVEYGNMLWTTKYAPKQMKDLVGNKAAVEKLAGWLRVWPESYRSGFKKPGKDGMGVYRAVLISGSPGIGKTTSAHLVAKTEGYSPLEFNASDARSKKLIEAMLQDTINNKSLDSWYSGRGCKGSHVPRMHERTVLIMDEVDGMSGGDRGGVGAINALIKKTKVPIICICNDRRDQKMRPFEHTTFNLSFRKPDAAQVKSRMLSIAFREKLKIPGEVMAQLIEAARSDIRSLINMLSAWKLGKDTMDFDESKLLGSDQTKPGLTTPFSLYSDLSSASMFSATSRKTLNDKAELYFQDHSLLPLMVAENYVKARPMLLGQHSGPMKEVKHLHLLSKASESISDGDIIDRMIHASEPHWSLMPLHSIASSVRPCSFIYGGTQTGFPTFPSWLGQSSKQQRLLRSLVDLQAKMSLVCSTSRHDLRQHYVPTMWGMLVNPILQQGSNGVDKVIGLMDEYYLGIADREAILELGLEPHNAEIVLRKVPNAVKAGFTRKYNSASHPIAFNRGVDVGGIKKVGKEPVPDLEDVVEEEVVAEEEEEEEVDEDEDDLGKDKLVKKSKAAVGAKGKSKAAAGGGRGKAKGTK